MIIKYLFPLPAARQPCDFFSLKGAKFTGTKRTVGLSKIIEIDASCA